MSVFTVIFFVEILFGKSDHGHRQLPSVATVFTHTNISSTDAFLYTTAPEGTRNAM